MKKLMAVVSAAALACMLSSCSVTLPVCATSNPVGSKVGEATATNFLGFWVAGDASIATAAKNGGIKNISTVDIKSAGGFLSFKYVTIVTGE
jgi:hypothetical protein